MFGKYVEGVTLASLTIRERISVLIVQKKVARPLRI